MNLKDFPEIICQTSKIPDGNMSFLHGDPIKALENRKKLLAPLGIEIDSLVCPILQLGNGVTLVIKEDCGTNAKKIDDKLKLNSLITNEPGLNLMACVADCMILAIYDPKNHAIALTHSGWQGLDTDILKNTLDKLSENFNTNPKDLVIEIGPSIGPCCYKSDPAIVKQKDDPKWAGFITPAEEGMLAVDIWGMAEKQLKDLGVLGENITNPKICTFHESEYFSHRKAMTGNSPDERFATILGIKA